MQSSRLITDPAEALHRGAWEEYGEREALDRLSQSPGIRSRPAGTAHDNSDEEGVEEQPRLPGRRPAPATEAASALRGDDEEEEEGPSPCGGRHTPGLRPAGTALEDDADEEGEKEQ